MTNRTIVAEADKCQELRGMIRKRSVGGEITLDDQGVFNLWRSTDLDELDIAGAVDFLCATGTAEREGERVKLKSRSGGR